MLLAYTTKPCRRAHSCYNPMVKEEEIEKENKMAHYLAGTDGMAAPWAVVWHQQRFVR